MCGFAGELARAAAPTATPWSGWRPRWATAVPTAQGSWAHEAVALAHRRLKIIDLSSAGEPADDRRRAGADDRLQRLHLQPSASCARELEGDGYRFFSTSDTEVILKAYAKWGRDCVSHFAGMFAFAIYEHATGRAAPGPRPARASSRCTWPRRAGALRFASTLPALLAGGGIDTVDRPGRAAPLPQLARRRAAAADDPQRRAKLPPATTMLVEPDGTRRLSATGARTSAARTSYADWSETDWSDAVLDALRIAVKRRMVSDVPVGVLLSGGLDSSLIVALLETSGQEKLATFSIGFDDVGDREGNEFKYSDVIAEQFGTDHHKIHVDTAACSRPSTAPWPR